MPFGVVRNGKVWDVVVPRNYPVSLVPVWLRHFDLETRKEQKILLCQICNMGRFGWSVVAGGEVQGLRLVEGFKQRWQAIQYAIKVRTDLDNIGTEGD